MNALALGDRLGQLRNILQFFATLDMSLLTQLLAAIQAVRAATTTTDRVKAVLALAKLVTQVTPNKVDDQLVGYVDGLLANETLLALVASLVDRLLSGQAAALDAPDETTLATARAAGLEWGTILEWVRTIAAIIQMIGVAPR